MSKKIVEVCFFFAVWLVMAESGIGTVMRLEVEGIVNSVGIAGSLALDGSVEVGSLMSGYALYDSDAADRRDNDNVGDYPVMSIWMEIGNYVFYEGPEATGSLFWVHLNDPTDQELGFSYSVGSIDGRFSGSVFVDGVEKGYNDLLWGESPDPYNLTLMAVGSTTTAADDALPLSMPDLALFDKWRKFRVGFTCVGPEQTGYFVIGGELTSVRIIPEPGTVLLLGMGMAVLMRKRRRK